MFLENADYKTWEKICLELKISPEDFSSFDQFPDELTLNLVLKISEALKIPPPDLLEAFGKYFVKFAKTSEYQSILEAFAETPIDLIKSLDTLHARLGLLFENLKPPSFWVEEISANEVLVFYGSERTLPLESFVRGLILGIFDMFDQKCTVEILPSRGSEKAIFKVIY